VQITLFIPCLVDQFFPGIGLSLYELLTDLGYETRYPLRQTCCGQPAYNAGYWKEAAGLAGNFLSVFSDAECIVCPSGSCVSMVRHGYRRLPLDPGGRALQEEIASRTYELTEFLAGVHRSFDLGATFEHRVAYHASCHLLRELGVRDAPGKILEGVGGLELVEMQGSEECCGFGGVFSARYRSLSLEIARTKLENAEAAGAEYLATCDVGCMLHLIGAAGKTGSRVKPVHIASILRSGGGVS
jgi:L-lactate dehydrogenase complex protein LldE